MLCQNTAPSRRACRADVRFLIRGSSAVEQSAVNRSVARSNRAPGANKIKGFGLKSPAPFSFKIARDISGGNIAPDWLERGASMIEMQIGELAAGVSSSRDQLQELIKRLGGGDPLSWHLPAMIETLRRLHRP